MGNIYRLPESYAVHQIQKRKSHNFKSDIYASRTHTQGNKIILGKIPAHSEIKGNEEAEKQNKYDRN